MYNVGQNSKQLTNLHYDVKQEAQGACIAHLIFNMNTYSHVSLG